MVQIRNPRSNAGYVKVVFVLCLTTLMSSIDTSIVSIGLRTIEEALNANFSSVQWVILSYMLALTSLIVAIGRIGDIFGKKKLFIFGIALFTVTSFLCGASVSIYELIVFRAFQGIGAAILIALSFAIVGDLIPKEKIMDGMAALTATMPIGFALGPSIGGFLISAFGWQSIFLLNVPLGAIAFFMALRFPSIPISEKVQKFDIGGMLILAATLVAYVLSVTLAENLGISGIVIPLIAATIVGVVVFIIVEEKTKTPLIHLKMFKDAIFSVSLVISVILYATTNGFNTIFPFFLEQAKDFSPSTAGLLMMAGPLGCAAFTPVANGMAKRLGNAKTMIFGILILGIGVLIMSTFGVLTSIITIAILVFLWNGGLAFFQAPNNAFIMSLAKPEQRGLISGLLNLARTIGQTTGIAVLGAFFYLFTRKKSIVTASPTSIVGGIHRTFLVAVLIVACAFLLGLTVYKPWKKGTTL
jgi:EmrB/QacA subfamily drug resistance transporter